MSDDRAILRAERHGDWSGRSSVSGDRRSSSFPSSPGAPIVRGTVPLQVEVGEVAAPPGRRTASPLVARLLPLHGTPTQGAVLAELRRVILAGDAPPGTVVPLDEVAAALGMSVIPVRESLKILIGEGLVEQHARGAYTVARLSRSELLELYAARGVLENTVLAAAVAVAGPPDHAHARAAHERLDAAVRDGDLRAYHRESRGFHFALLAPARMRRFVAMVESAWNLTESYRPMARLGDAERQRLHADHRAMLEAFVAGDADGLLACAGTHHRRLLDAIATLPPGTGSFVDEPDAAQPIAAETERSGPCTSP
jgi:DNA-binding GntR family transcriptional regulator